MRQLRTKNLEETKQELENLKSVFTPWARKRSRRIRQYLKQKGGNQNETN